MAAPSSLKHVRLTAFEADNLSIFLGLIHAFWQFQISLTLFLWSGTAAIFGKQLIFASHYQRFDGTLSFVVGQLQTTIQKNVHENVLMI